MDVEKLEFSDSTVGDVMVDRPNADVAVRVVTENPTQPNGFCSHAQAMVTDCGLSAQEVEAGSVNIGGNSLG
ncbi:hypothetical protein TUE45_04994 [Streptomyces reticuli]|nr:hypothetical protein TUE45_04994 [Streptomyces reticuli]